MTGTFGWGFTAGLATALVIVVTTSAALEARDRRRARRDLRDWTRRR